ncbi:glycosyltransferase family 2 protein, partial [Desulfobulbus sp. N3]|nr:glycosyltransferase family 2 protein [Desulfobulbus sp. N3]
MISVIIPTFNRAGFLEQAIGSVLDQSCACGEILVVDDGSNDGTSEIVRRISRPAKVPIRYLYQENKGASASRNMGIVEARHDFLCFLDSDDRWAPHKLKMQLEAMEHQPQY